VPFFLGPLLKDYVKPPAGSDAESAEHGFSSFDFGEEFDSPKSFGEIPPVAPEVKWTRRGRGKMSIT